MNGSVRWPVRGAADPSELGGKASGLTAIARAGLRVPPWFAVDARAFDELVRRPSVAPALRALLAAIANDERLVGPAAADLRERILDVVLDGALRDAIALAYRRLAPGEGPVAVRSSASCEDGSERSFAGMFETVLDRRGEDALVQAIRTCWASAYGDRVVRYCGLHGLSLESMRLAVVVQRMVPARVAGVLFTSDPASGTDEAMVIAAVAGTAERLVAGELEGTTYRLARRNGSTLPGSPTNGLLCGRELKSLWHAARRLERARGGPQDVEWAIADSRLEVLQSRPMVQPPAAAEMHVWDNANIVESFPDITQPLTYSVARQAYAAIYRQAAQLAGIRRSVLDANSDAFDRMIGLIRGRVYYHLNSWYALLALLPGFAVSRRYMEQMMGVHQSIDWTARPAVRGAERVRIALLAARMIVLAMGVRRRVVRFQRDVEDICRAEEAVDVAVLRPGELVARYDALRARIFSSWQAPILNDFLTMAFHGVVREITSRPPLASDPGLANDLLRADRPISSAEPARAIAALARMVSVDEHLRAAFASDRPPKDVLAGARTQAEFAAALDRYLDEFGHRHAQELKLERPSLRDDPGPVVAGIRAYLERPDVDLEAVAARDHALRRAAEARVRWRLGVPRAAIVLWLVRRAREHIREREAMRLARGRVFGIARRLFVTLGHRLHERGQLAAPDDVFYLTADELCGHVRGTAVNGDLASLVRLRRREFDAYAAEPPFPDRLRTGEVAGGGVIVDAATAVTGDELRGRPACPGVIRGAARVIRAPHEERLERGEILVARVTDPGWVALFPFAAGILVERGSALSHSAILARELGIPAIVGIAGLLDRVQTGQRLEMDGRSGTVRLLE